MIIDKLNLNHLRIFECVYRHRSMTKAAKELHLTQSGVSQHMAALEEMLEVPLFDRLKQRLVPTGQADILFRRSFEALGGIEQALTELKGGEQKFAGSVSLGVPIEFGNHVILPLLAKFCAQHPLIQTMVRYGFANEMNEELLRGSLDFAFVDSFSVDPRVHAEAVTDEVLHLCAAPELLQRAGVRGVNWERELSSSEKRKFFESLSYVDYQPGEPVLRMWFRHHLGSKGLKLNVRSTLMDVQGIGRLVISGMGAGVLPGHYIERLRKQMVPLYRFEGSGKPLKNRISVAYLSGRRHSSQALALRSWILENLKRTQ